MYPTASCCPPPPSCPCGRPYRCDCCPAQGSEQWSCSPPEPPVQWGSNFTELRNQWSCHVMRANQVRREADMRATQQKRTASQVTCNPCCSSTDTDISYMNQSDVSSNEVDNFTVREIPMRPAPSCYPCHEPPERDCCDEPPERDCCRDAQKKCVSWKPNVMLIETWRSKSSSDSATKKCFVGNSSKMSVEICHCNKPCGECVCSTKQEPRCVCNKPIGECTCSIPESESEMKCSCNKPLGTCLCKNSPPNQPIDLCLFKQPSVNCCCNQLSRLCLCRKPSVQSSLGCSCGKPTGLCLCQKPCNTSAQKCSCNKPVWACLCIKPQREFCGKPACACPCSSSSVPRCSCEEPNGSGQYGKPSNQNRKTPLNQDPARSACCGKPSGTCFCNVSCSSSLARCVCGDPLERCLNRGSSTQSSIGCCSCRQPVCMCQYRDCQDGSRQNTNARSNEGNSERNNPPSCKETSLHPDVQQRNNGCPCTTKKVETGILGSQAKLNSKDSQVVSKSGPPLIDQSRNRNVKPRDSLALKGLNTADSSLTDVVLDDGYRYPRCAQKRLHSNCCWDKAEKQLQKLQLCSCGCQDVQETSYPCSSVPSHCSSINIRIATRNNRCACNTAEPELDGLFISLKPCDCERAQSCKPLTDEEVYTDDPALRPSSERNVFECFGKQEEARESGVNNGQQCPCTGTKKPEKQSIPATHGKPGIPVISHTRNKDMIGRELGDSCACASSCKDKTDERKKVRETGFDSGQVSDGEVVQDTPEKGEYKSDTDKLDDVNNKENKTKGERKYVPKNRRRRKKDIIESTEESVFPIRKTCKLNKCTCSKKRSHKGGNSSDKSSSRHKKQKDRSEVDKEEAYSSDSSHGKTDKSSKCRRRSCRSRKRRRHRDNTGGLLGALREYSLSRSKLQKHKRGKSSKRSGRSKRRNFGGQSKSRKARSESPRSKKQQSSSEEKDLVLFGTGYQDNEVFGSDGGISNSKYRKMGEKKHKKRKHAQNNGFKSKFSLCPFFSNLFK